MHPGTHLWKEKWAPAYHQAHAVLVLYYNVWSTQNEMKFKHADIMKDPSFSDGELETNLVVSILCLRSHISDLVSLSQTQPTRKGLDYCLTRICL